MDRIQSILKKVGRGKTLARDLSREESREALEGLLSGAFRPSQAGAFLQAMRIKESTRDELEGARMALQDHRSGVRAPEADLVVNLCFDTSRKGGILSLPACALLKRAGLTRPLVVWEPPSLFPDGASIEISLRALREDPLLAPWEPPTMRVRDVVQGWDGLSGLRAELGFRTLLNTLEKLVVPVEGVPVVAGVSHGTFFGRLAEAILSAGASRAVVVRGHHGTCDLGPGEEPTRWTAAHAGGISQGESRFDSCPDGGLLLASRLSEWPERASGGDPAWRALVGEQAAFLLAASRGMEIGEARGLVSEKGGFP